MSKTIRAPHGIDLNAPGGLAALFAFHRGTFGDATMSAAPAEGGTPPAAPAEGVTPAPAATPATPAPPATPAAPAAKSPEWDGKVESLDPAVQKIIADARKEAGDERVAAKTLAAIQKALNPDAKTGEKPDAEQLTKDLAARDATARQAQTELAVYKLASKHGADADALLDSRGFLAKLTDIDPTDTAKVTKAIEDAVKDNPKLKAVLAATKSGTNFSGGPGEGATKRANLNDALNSHYGTN